VETIAGIGCQQQIVNDEEDEGVGKKKTQSSLNLYLQFNLYGSTIGNF
jgi:hypothetical protein